MGEWIYRELGSAVYTIAALSWVGKSGRAAMPPSRVPPLADSLEAWLHAAGKPYAFLDFRALPKQHWLRNRILSRPLGVFDPMVADWANTFDAVLCVDEAFADSMEGTAPAWVKIRQ